MNWKKISSFTMVDLMTGMILTSLIIGFVFHLFTVLNRQLSSFSNTNMELQKHLVSKNYINQIFFEKNHLYRNSPTQFFYFKDGVKIAFTLEDDKLIRSVSFSSDTIFTNVERLDLIVNSDEKNIDEIESIQIELGLLELPLKLNFEFEKNLADDLNEELRNGN